MTFYALSALINCITTLFLGIFVFLKRNRNNVSYSFSLFSFFVASWSGFYFLWQISKDADSALLWTRVLMSFAIFIPWFYILFVYSFLNIVKQKRIHLLASFIVLTVFLPLNVFSSNFIKGVEPRLSFAFWPIPGYYYNIFISLWCLLVVYASFVLYNSLRYSSGTKRNQLKFLFLGMVVGFSGGATNYFLWYNIPIPPIGNPAVLFFVGSTAYAIMRHRFLDFRLLAARSLLYTLLLGILSILYVSSVFLVSQFFLTATTNTTTTAIYTVLALFTSLTFPPLKRYLEKCTNKIFFKSHYSANELLYSLSQTLNNTMGFEDVLKNVFALLNEGMHIQSVVFAVKLQGRKNLPVTFSESGDYAIYTYGQGPKNLVMLQQLSDTLQKYRSSVVVDDLQTELAAEEDASKRVIYEWMIENEVGMVLPLRIKNEVIGAIVLGGKQSGEPYSTEDVNVLETFALQAAIGIENILLFMHSRDFGERLKVEVEKATAELKQKNKNLEILRHLENIITTTLDLREMCQKIVDTISWELGYDGALISLVDLKRKVLVPTAVSQTPIIKKALNVLPVKMEDIVTPLDEKRNMSVQAIDLHSKITTTSLADAFSPGLPRAVSASIQQIVGMKGMIIYPLFSKDKPIGTLALAMHVEPHDIPAAEMNVLDAFMDEVGIALENSYLYEEAKKANDALEVSNKRLVELDKMKDEFVSVASHELRTPMTAINGYVWMLLNGKGGELQEKQRYYLQRVSQSTSRLINLVNDMLTISRIEGGRTKIENKNFDLVDLIKAVVEELQIKADEKGIKLSVESEDKINVFADIDKVHEILINLIGNALKFTEKGTVTTTVLDRGEFVSVAVRDTGKGIAQEDMPKLFTKFGRLDNSYATVAETTGTGLGLFICKKYLEAMGGTIGVTSTIGKGSSFTFTLKKEVQG